MSNGLPLSPLTAISPVDGRYRSKCDVLAQYFSEFATIRYRVKVEVEYFIALSKVGLPQLPAVPDDTAARLRAVYDGFSQADAREVKDIESTTNHDVKAVEYFLKRHFEALGLSRYSEFIHFGLTSQDINNTAFHMMLRDAIKEQMAPALDGLTKRIAALAESCDNVPMLARTHGQPASPTTLGKELFVFAYRLHRSLQDLLPLHGDVIVSGKFGGATGNFNAHTAAFPGIDWERFGYEFLRSLGLERELFTTQISNYDGLAAIFHSFCRINNIIMDLDRDIWQYISMGYFKQRIKAGEVGSSAMPHKVNPIDFENSEGNLGIANAIFGHLASKLPVSRLQRDLTDSTVLRNIGVPMAHTLIAVASTLKGLDKLIINREAIDADLNDNWAVVAEGIQTILRREGFPKPYEALKALTRTNEHITAESIHRFIASLEGISEEVRAELAALTPFNYIGDAAGCSRRYRQYATDI